MVLIKLSKNARKLNFSNQNYLTSCYKPIATLQRVVTHTHTPHTHTQHTHTGTVLPKWPTFLYPGHNGGKVIIKKDDVRDLFGHVSPSDAHGYA